VIGLELEEITVQVILGFGPFSVEIGSSLGELDVKLFE